MGDWRTELCLASMRAFGDSDPEAAAALYDSECVWDVGQDIGTVFGQQRFEGPDGLRQFMAKIEEVFPDWEPTIEEFREGEDDSLLIRGAGAGSSKLSGITLEMPDYWQVARFRDGKILSVITQSGAPPPGWDEAEPVA